MDNNIKNAETAVSIEEVSVEKEGKGKLFNYTFCQSLSSIAFYIIQIIVSVFFVLGVANYGNEGITPIKAVELILTIFDIGAVPIIPVLVTVAIGIFYVMYLVFIILKLIDATKSIFKVVNKSTKDKKTYVLISCYASIRTCLYIITFSLMTIIANQERPTGYLIAVIILMLVNLLITTCLIDYDNYKLPDNKFDKKNYIFVIVRNLLICLAILIFIINFNGTYFLTIWHGIQAVFQGTLFFGGAVLSISNVYLAIVSDILLLILCVKIVRYIWWFTNEMIFSYNKYYIEQVKSSGKFIVVLGIVIALLEILANLIILNKGGSTVSIGLVFSQIISSPMIYYAGIAVGVIILVANSYLKQE